MPVRNNLIELRHLRYFSIIAEELHFGKAASMLFISQPGLSRQIKQFEDLLGVQLFDRNNRNVRLTEAGLYLKDEVKYYLSNLDSVFNHAAMISKGIEGNLNFGYVGSAMQNIIPNVLVQFRKTYPKIVFDLKEMDNSQQVKDLLNREIDLGFVRIEEAPEELMLYPVYKDTFSLVLPSDHRITEENFQHLSQLKSESFILFNASYSPTYHEKIMDIFKFSGFKPNVSHSTVHANTIYKLVENHFGVSIVPTSFQTVFSQNLQFLELKGIPQRTTLSAIWNVTNRNPTLAKLLDLMGWN